ncbi:MAG TPA: hypothetical protein VFU27_15495 [Terriglobales bacterium]|nr:hypothetical protein [Terriglobales bacterium]
MNHRDGSTVIRMDERTRNTVAIIVCIIVAVLLISVILSLLGIIHNPNSPSVLVGYLTVAILGGAALVLSLFRDCVVLFPDASIVVKRNLMPSRRLQAKQIVARRVTPAGWRKAFCHVLITAKGDEVKLPAYLERNPQFQSWLDGIPLRSSPAGRDPR